MKTNNLVRAIYLAGALGVLSGCPINSSPQPYVKFPANMNLDIYPKRNVCFSIIDNSKEFDITSCEAYLIERKTGIETKLDLSFSETDLKRRGSSKAFWDIVGQYSDIPEGECTFILEMTDEKGKKVHINYLLI